MLEETEALIIGRGQISKLDKQSLGSAANLVSIVKKSHKSLEEMPKGKSGIVIGSGGNTETWKSRGWKTLDRNPRYGADITTDANRLERRVLPKSQDFLFAEELSFDKIGDNDGKYGVKPSNLLEGAREVLRTNGQLLIKTRDLKLAHETVDIPSKFEFADLMAKHGFDTVIEVGDFEYYANGDIAQEVLYHCRKRGK